MTDTTSHTTKRIRKLMTRKGEWTLPEINEDMFILDTDDMEDSTEVWLDSLSGKSEYDLTEMLFVQGL